MKIGSEGVLVVEGDDETEEILRKNRKKKGKDLAEANRGAGSSNLVEG